jgi:hypothetical protein
MNCLKFILTLGCMILAACSPGLSYNQPGNLPDMQDGSTPISTTIAPLSTAQPEGTHPYAPEANDDKYIRSNAYIESSQLVTMESFPLSFTLNLAGSLPSPCHHLRVDLPLPDSEKRINIEVYSVVEPSRICAQQLQPFDVNIPLGDFPEGHYSLWVNGDRIAEFDG